MLSTVMEALSSTEFLVGLRNGAIGLALVILPALKIRSVPIAGLMWVGASLAGLWTVQRIPTELVAGSALLVMAGFVHQHLGSSPWMRPLLALPGAWLVGFRSGIEGTEWAPWAVLGIIVVGAPAVAATTERLVPRGVGMLMWVVTVGGLYGTVPDTEQALVLVGAAMPLALLGLVNLSRFGTAGAYAAVGLYGWVAATGGVGRPASTVGALACLGVFLVAPLAARIRPDALGQWPIVLAAHVGVAAVGSRVAGLRTSVMEAVLIGGGGLLLGLAALLATGYLQRERVTDPDSRADVS